ncbi:sensor histidine kinase [Leucobacter sp. G161]|uniref:sensor histidine kinase n=1 Tax=Leucobacter sp. G161 TaxID=663704 RepID=UPI00073CE293|nr:sensor histidine kinase [Leucobacter sp. G161]KUF06820.1 hypothetical protein AUL38_11265 [Leucobacter sp. G161]
MDPRASPLTAGPDRPLTAMHIAVDLGFGILMAVSVFRYFSNHPFDGVGVWALALAVGSTLAYAAAVLGADRGKRQTIGILTATALWLPLAVIAPSFSWCAFALIFAVYRVLPRRQATVTSAGIVVTVSTGLLIMSDGQDLGLVLGPFFGGIVVSTAYVALDRTLENRRHLTDELLATREQLARTERDAGALAERGRFASELHDTVVQRTASALLLLESTDESRDRGDAAIAEVREVLREALVETRQLLHGLQAPAEQESLSAALRDLAHSHAAEFTAVGEDHAVEADVAHALLRVTQEALVNAGKHADARTVRVTLTFFDDAVGVDIADDGRGFNTEQEQPVEAGYGLRAMAWRIENLGGRFTLESAIDQGTVIACVVPCVIPEDSRA